MFGFGDKCVRSIFGCEFCFSNAEIMNVVANGLRGELVLELQVNDLVKTHPKKWKKWDLVYIKICFFGVKEISMFVNHEHICIKEFLVEKLEKDFEYKPGTDLRKGLREFAEWYADFYK